MGMVERATSFYRPGTLNVVVNNPDDGRRTGSNLRLSREE